MTNEIRIRNTSAAICDLFEELLDANDITIPNEERTGDESEARIYGDTYSELEDAVTGILANLCKEVRENPAMKINTDEY